MALDESLKSRIEDTLKSHDIVVFMKGTKNFPQCGFSATVAHILAKELKVDFHGVDILKDPDIRQGMKEYTSWPTFPQVYVRGKFVGGCDIVRDMFESGELAPLVTGKSEG